MPRYVQLAALLLVTFYASLHLAPPATATHVEGHYNCPYTPSLDTQVFTFPVSDNEVKGASGGLESTNIYPISQLIPGTYEVKLFSYDDDHPDGATQPYEQWDLWMLSGNSSSTVKRVIGPTTELPDDLITTDDTYQITISDPISHIQGWHHWAGINWTNSVHAICVSIKLLAVPTPTPTMTPTPTPVATPTPTTPPPPTPTPTFITQPIPPCPFEPNSETKVVKFPPGSKLYANPPRDTQTNTTGFNLPGGTYDIELFSWDDRSGGPSSQKYEQWDLLLLGSNNPSNVIQTIGPTNDIGSTVDFTFTSFQGVTIPDGTSHAMAKHHWAGKVPDEEEVDPICAAFHQVDPTPPSTPIPTIPPAPTITPTPTPIATPSCPYVPDSDTFVYSFPPSTKLDSSNPGLYATATTPFTLNSGVYDIRMFSYDNHPEVLDQIYERWNIKLLRSSTPTDSIVAIGPSKDIPYSETSIETEYTTVIVSDAVSYVQATHSAAGDPNFNSVYPICVAFDYQPADPWFQVHSGGIYSADKINTIIPQTVNEPYLIKSDSTHAPDLAAAREIQLNPGGSVSTTQWTKDEQYNINPTSLDLDEIFSYLAPSIDVTNYTGYAPRIADAGSDGIVVYKVDPSLGPITLNNSGGSWNNIDIPVIILSEHDIIIPASIGSGTQTISLGTNGFLFMATRENILVDSAIASPNSESNTYNLEGMFMTGKSFDASYNGDGGRLNIHGNVIVGVDPNCASVLVNCTYESSRTHTENYLYPADFIQYNPKLLLNIPTLLTQSHVRWGEVE